MIAPGERRAVTFLFFANGFGFGGWSAAIAPMRAALGLSNGELGLVLFTLAAGAVAFMPLAGLAGARLGGSGRLARNAGLVFALAFALAGLSPGPIALALVGFIIGAGNGVMDVSMNAHASGVERRAARPLMSAFHAAFSVGGLAGAGVGALLLSVGLGWRGLLIAFAAGIAALVAASAFGLVEGEPPEAGAGVFGRPTRELAGLAVVACLCFVVEGAMIDWDGVYLSTLGARAATAPLGYAAFAAAMILGRLLGDRLVARVGRLPAIAGGTGLAAVGLTLAAAAPAPGLAAVGFALVGAGLANVVPALFGMAAALSAVPARGVAAAATAGYCGLLAGPPLVGLLASLSDLRTSMGALAAFALVAAGLAGTLRRRPAGAMA